MARAVKVKPGSRRINRNEWRTSCANVSSVGKVHGSRDCSRSRSALPSRRRAAARASSPLTPSASARACAFISS
jgi:hypothetical protein